MLLQGTNLQDALLESRGHLLMHCGGIVAFDEVRFVAIADEQCFQFVVRDASEDRWVRDLVAVEVQNGQDGAIANRDSEIYWNARRWPAGLFRLRRRRQQRPQ